jgi:hypothetical protein
MLATLITGEIFLKPMIIFEKCGFLKGSSTVPGAPQVRPQVSLSGYRETSRPVQKNES